MNWMCCRLPITLLHISRVEEILITLFEWNKYITVAVRTPPSQTQIMTFQWEQMKWANFRTHYKVGSENRKVSKEWELIDGDWETFVGFSEPFVGLDEVCVCMLWGFLFLMCVWASTEPKAELTDSFPLWGPSVFLIDRHNAEVQAPSLVPMLIAASCIFMSSLGIKQLNKGWGCWLGAAVITDWLIRKAKKSPWKDQKFYFYCREIMGVHDGGMLSKPGHFRWSPVGLTRSFVQFLFLILFDCVPLIEPSEWWNIP